MTRLPSFESATASDTTDGVVARLRQLLLGLEPAGVAEDPLATELTDTEVERHLISMGYDLVPDEIATWFASVRLPLRVGQVVLLNLPSAVALAGVWRTMQVFEASLGVDVDSAPYLPVASSGGVLWSVRLHPDPSQRVVRTNVAHVVPAAFPSLLAALEHWSGHGGPPAPPLGWQDVDDEGPASEVRSRQG